jgi:hypothetical protein
LTFLVSWITPLIRLEVVPHFDICDPLGSNRVRRKILAAGTQLKNADSLDVAAFA